MGELLIDTERLNSRLIKEKVEKLISIFLVKSKGKHIKIKEYNEFLQNQDDVHLAVTR